ncbi:DNA polymerase III subunit gamma/tau [Aerococcaceae bacterium DSM 111022]|nr:DNA polymerase III subunit gamma/tau [Aerococcaceae bacterium DSM 111022]
MSYQALYRVWRPQTFDELVGQEMISETLKNAVSNEQLSHAYLFTGPRGTGKTSAAKILAKAVNCPNETDGNPCNNCEICELITSGQLSDVNEIDAASNNGVEEIRDLRENVRYAATQAQYKVYIIDEVHMLTTGAFNALLKTLEEPPAQVIFILATTEPHKIPATIISRTQRYDFKRIQSNDIIKRLKEVLEFDGVSYDEEALSIIARAANGGLRDALSLLDQALSYGNDELTVTTALEVSGSLSQVELVSYLLAIHHSHSGEALEILREQFNQGKQASRFIEELISFIRDVLLTIHTKENHTLLNDAELEPLHNTMDSRFYYEMIDQLNQAQQNMRFSNQPDLYVEVVTIQLANHQEEQAATHPTVINMDPVNDEIKALQEQIAQLNSQLDGQHKQMMALQETTSNQNSGITSNQEGISLTDRTAEQEPLTPRQRPQTAQTRYQLNNEDVYYVLNQATSEAITQWKANWKIMLNRLAPQDRMPFKGSQVRAAGGGYVVISFENELYAGTLQNNQTLRHKFEEIAERTFDKPIGIVVILEKDWLAVRQNYITLRQRNQNKPLDLEGYTAPENIHHVQSVQNDEIGPVEPSIIDNEPETVDVVEAPPSVDTLMSQQDMVQVEEETEEKPVFISKAIEIFGEDNINIVYDE